MKIEIVSTAVATDLLHGAGTGACPEGATMDLLKPRICPPGEGLQMTRKNAVPCARAVPWLPWVGISWRKCCEFVAINAELTVNHGEEVVVKVVH